MKLCNFDLWRCHAFVVLALTLAGPALAQQLPAPPTPPPNPAPNPGSGGNLADFIFKKAPYEFWLTFLIIAFGLTVLALYIYAIRNISNRRPEDVSRALTSSL